LKTLGKAITKYMQHPDKRHATYVLNTWNIQINTLATYLWKTIETLGKACNILVQPLQHMQHPDLFLQYQHETLATSR
jgi:hypothetical protein